MCVCMYVYICVGVWNIHIMCISMCVHVCVCIQLFVQSLHRHVMCGYGHCGIHAFDTYLINCLRHQRLIFLGTKFFLCLSITSVRVLCLYYNSLFPLFFHYARMWYGKFLMMNVCVCVVHGTTGFWYICTLFLAIAIYLDVRINKCFCVFKILRPVVFQFIHIFAVFSHSVLLINTNCVLLVAEYNE